MRKKPHEVCFVRGGEGAKLKFKEVLEAMLYEMAVKFPVIKSVNVSARHPL